MCANILRFNHTPVKTPINIHKEAPLMVVILIVRHCEEKSVAVLVVILMCDGFDQKSVALTLLMAVLLYVALLTKIVWPFWPMCDRLANLTKRAVTINPFNGSPAICGPFDQNSVAVLANVWPTGQFDQKGCDHLWPF